MKCQIDFAGIFLNLCNKGRLIGLAIVKVRGNALVSFSLVKIVMANTILGFKYSTSVKKMKAHVQHSVPYCRGIVHPKTKLKNVN